MTEFKLVLKTIKEGVSFDTERALQAMEACQADAADGVKGRAEKLLNIFQSDLFQALLGNTAHRHSQFTSLTQINTT
ncbi:disks large homolog 4-like [Cyprinodon tularosa]|uniref:disks large homolog 4-like n=1 Tax=Cyprinodon tularosa TaxID=77115 RepID=UPI0018E21560|nr:disks large homolog 4-like [Cyprinodon tularosa]